MANPEARAEFVDLLAERFSLKELDNLCHRLGLDRDNVPGETKQTKAWELFSYLERREWLPALVSAVHRERPGLPWPDLGLPSPEPVIQAPDPQPPSQPRARLAGTWHSLTRWGRGVDRVKAAAIVISVAALAVVGALLVSPGARSTAIAWLAGAPQAAPSAPAAAATTGRPQASAPASLTPVSTSSAPPSSTPPKNPPAAASGTALPVALGPTRAPTPSPPAAGTRAMVAAAASLSGQGAGLAGALAEPLAAISQPGPSARFIITEDNAGELAERLSLTTEGTPKEVAFSPDGSTLAVAAGHILFYDLRTMQPARPAGNEAADMMAFSRDWSRMAAVLGTGERRVQVWDLAGGQASPVQSFPAAQVNGIALSPDGSLLAIAIGKAVRVLNVANETPPVTLAPEGLSNADSLAFSPDGQILAGTGYGTYLWRTSAWRQAPQLLGTGWMDHATFAPNGDRLAVVKDGRAPKIFQLPSGSELYDFSPPKIGDITTSATAAGLAFSPDGRLMAVASGGTATLRLWSLGTGRQLVEATGHTGTITAAAFAPNGAAVVTAGEDKSLRFWGVGN